MRFLHSRASILLLLACPAAAAEKTLVLAGAPVGVNTPLSSGVPAPFSLPAVSSPTLFTGDDGFRIVVPAGATRLEVRLFVANPNVDVDLFVRFGADLTVSGGSPVADFRSENTHSNEIIAVRSTSSPGLREGTYYIALGLFSTGTAVSGALTATVSTGPILPAGTLLASEAPATFSFSPVTGPTLFNGHYGYGINVPSGSNKLEVRLVTATGGADLDLFVRLTTDVAVSGSTIVADHHSSGPAGAETVTITPASTPALQAGTYYIALALFTNGVPVTGTLTASVSGGSPRIELAPATALDFGAVTAGESKDLTLTLRNTGTAALNVTALTTSNTQFTAVSPAAPFAVAAAGEQAVALRFRPTATGAQSATLTIASNDASRPSASVALTGSGSAAANPPPPPPGVSTATLSFDATAGSNPPPQAFQVSAPSGTTLTWRASATQPWLAVSPPQGTVTGAPVDVTVSVNTAGLAPQAHSGEIRVSSVVVGADPRAPSQTVVAAIAVTLALTTSPNPVIAVSRSSLSFSAGAGSDPAPQTFAVRNIGAGTLNFAVTTSQPWLSVSPAEGAAADPAIITVAAVVAGLEPNTYNGEIVIAEMAPAAGRDPAQKAATVIAVRVQISSRNTTGAPGGGPQGSIGRDAPLIALNGIVNAASFTSPVQPGGGVALGSVFSIIGSRLGPPAFTTASAFPLASSLAGVSVTVTRGSVSVDAIPLAVSGGQLNAILPSNAPLGDVLIAVRYNGQASPPVTARTLAASFGAFTRNGSGRGPGLIQNFISETDQPLNSVATPASPGQIVTLWGTGLGPLASLDNVPPPAGRLPVAFEVFVGGRPAAELLYSGRAPCCAGIDLIIFRLPADAPSGCSVPLEVRAAGIASNPVDIAIAPCATAR